MKLRPLPMHAHEMPGSDTGYGASGRRCQRQQIVLPAILICVLSLSMLGVTTALKYYDANPSPSRASSLAPPNAIPSPSISTPSPNVCSTNTQPSSHKETHDRLTLVTKNRFRMALALLAGWADVACFRQFEYRIPLSSFACAMQCPVLRYAMLLPGASGI